MRQDRLLLLHSGLNLHYLQHAPFEGLAHVGSWARRRGLRVSGTRLFSGEPLPRASPGTDRQGRAPTIQPSGGRIDLLVVLGGPMGVNDEALHPWLRGEKRFLEAALRGGVKTLGICLGAQLLAAVLGARVFRNREREIGWLPIELTDDGLKSPLGALLDRTGPSAPIRPGRSPGLDRGPAPERVSTGDSLPLLGRRRTVFQWHGDTFALPKGARNLATSEACEHQAFAHGDSALGLQFHLEMTSAAVERIIRRCYRDAGAGPFIQTPATMRRLAAGCAPGLNAAMDSMLDRWLLGRPTAGRTSLGDPSKTCAGA